jgi:hypothetical protein
MSNRKEAKRFAARVEQAVEELRREPGLPFDKLLEADLVERFVTELGVVFRDRIYTPVVTLWVFLSQVLSPDHSCREAVARLIAHRVAHGEDPCSPETGTYCTARQRLPEALFTKLVRATAEQSNLECPDAWLWKGRRVKIVDGSTVTMPDTAENQAEYPQPSSQPAGLGFPMARIVVVFCLTLGTVLEWAAGPCRGKRTGENNLFRGLRGGLEAGDVLLADRYFASYWEFALLETQGVDLVTRVHQRRVVDFRRGFRLGPWEHLVVWAKPPQRPDWLDEATYRGLPDQIVVRELKVRVARRGFRVRQFVIATTLFDDEQVSAEELAALYRARWHAELDLRSLKAAMHMATLRCRTPEMVRKEIAMHLVAYNLLRRVMAEAARMHDLRPRDISFTGALQTVQAFRAQGLLDRVVSPTIHATLLTAIASHQVGDRPNRVEPRAVKRRAKHALLTKPRPEARKQLLKTA